MEQNLASLLASRSSLGGATQRRSSSRSIRRKKFDDELVEYSGRAYDANAINLPSTSKSVRIRPPSGPSTSADVSALVSPAPVRRPGTKRGRSRHSRHSVSAVKDLGRWKPTDDLLLINAVVQTCDLRTVERGVKFSCRFTYSEISQRWQALLYDPVVSRVAIGAIRNLHPDVIAAIQQKALYSNAEEELLANIKSNPDPKEANFEQLLKENPQVFHHARTPKALHAHWSLMKQYYLLKEQQYIPDQLTFSDAEETINDSSLGDPRDEALEREILLADRRSKREIRTLEEEIRRLNAVAEKLQGAGEKTTDSQTVATIKGRTVRYLMRSQEVTIGRSTASQPVDVDLNLEAMGPFMKVSRRQGTIRMGDNGHFFIANEGKRPIFVDGKPVITGAKHRLFDQSVLEIAGMRFIFQVNFSLVDFVGVETLRKNLVA